MFYVIGNYWRKFIHKTSKNINRLHKYSRDLLSVIIILGAGVNGDEEFFNGMTMNDMGNRSHVIEYSHGSCVVVSFDKNVHEGYIWTGNIAVLYFILHKSIFLHFVHHSTKFYDRYIDYYDRKNILMMMVKVSNQNGRLESFIIQNIRRHMVIKVVLFPYII